MTISKDRYIQIFLHLLVWSLLAIVLFLYPSLAYKGLQLPSDFTIKQIVHLCLMLGAYYANAYWMVPRLLLKKKYLLFAGAMILFICFAAYVMALVDDLLDLKEQMKHIWGNKPGLPHFDMFGFLTTLITLGISTSISVMHKWNTDNEHRLNLEKEKVTMELSVLKAQIHPHFFFNTLNSIYALSFTDADRSRKVLTRLSAIMRYLLYETDLDKIALDKELCFIRNYIDIMKLRLNADTNVEFSIPENPLPVSVAPMILMPYVENVFKHGIDESEGVLLSIHIGQDEKGIRLTTRNRIAARPAHIAGDVPGGIGMQNTFRRLELLYKNRYHLSTRVLPETNEFELELELQLV